MRDFLSCFSFLCFSKLRVCRESVWETQLALMLSLQPLPTPLHQLEWRWGGSDFPSENLVARNCSLQKLLSMPTSIQWACPRGYLQVPLYTDCSSPWPTGHHQPMRDRIWKIPASLLLRKNSDVPFQKVLGMIEPSCPK